MKKIVMAAAAALFSVAGSAGAGTVYSSADLGPTGTFDFGYTLSANQFLGSEFDLFSRTVVTSVGGHIGGFTTCDQSTLGSGCADNKFFAAIIDLGAPGALPNFLPSQLQSVALAFSFFSAPVLSADILIPLSVTLDPGYYGLVFGANLDNSNIPKTDGGSFGVTGSMPYNNTTLPGSTFFRTTQYADPTWLSAPDGMRFVVNGFNDLPGCGPSGGRPPKCNPDISVVPLPAALPLLLAGLGGLGFVGRRKKKAA